MNRRQSRKDATRRCFRRLVREKFTMETTVPDCAARIVKLYEEGLIYRGNRIVNWCPNDQTVLSDLEVIKDPQQANSLPAISC